MGVNGPKARPFSAYRMLTSMLTEKNVEHGAWSREMWTRPQAKVNFAISLSIFYFLYAIVRKVGMEGSHTGRREGLVHRPRHPRLAPQHSTGRGPAIPTPPACRRPHTPPPPRPPRSARSVRTGGPTPAPGRPPARGPAAGAPRQRPPPQPRLGRGRDVAGPARPAASAHVPCAAWWRGAPPAAAGLRQLARWQLALARLAATSKSRSTTSRWGPARRWGLHAT